MRVFDVVNLTRDPEIRYYQDQAAANQISVARFSVASERRFKKEGDPSADFFNCVAFGKTAEVIEKYCKKGTRVFIEGRLQNDNYTNKDGQQVYSTQILVDEIKFCEKKGDSAAPTAAPAQASAPAQQNGSAPAPSQGFMNIPDGIDDELPFA